MRQLHWRRFCRPEVAHRLLQALLATFLLILVAGEGLATGKHPVLTAARVGGDAERTRFVADLTFAIGFNVYILPNPYRVLIDLPEVDFNLPPGSGHQAMGLIREFRYGRLAKGRSRMVIDLTGPALIEKSYVLHARGAQPARLVIDLVRTDARTFSQIHRQEEPKLAEARKEAEKNAKILLAPDAARVPVETPPLSAEFLATGSTGASGEGSNTQDTSIEPAAHIQNASTAKVPLPRPKPDRSGNLLPAKKKLVPVERTNRDHYVIVIDPGHGGRDPGAISTNKKVTEKVVALKFARMLRDRLAANKRYKVYLTRDSDVFLTLQKRVSIARRLKADLFISVHADALKNRRVRGSTVYTLSETASDEEAAELARKENRADIIAGVDLGAESEDITGILIDLAQRETKNHSTYLAKAVARNLKGVVGLNRRPLRSAGFRVLKAPDVPSILIELGFLSNRHDVHQLQSARWRKRAAGALAAGVDRYFAAKLAAKR